MVVCESIKLPNENTNKCRIALNKYNIIHNHNVYYGKERDTPTLTTKILNFTIQDKNTKYKITYFTKKCYL